MIQLQTFLTHSGLFLGLFSNFRGFPTQDSDWSQRRFTDNFPPWHDRISQITFLTSVPQRKILSLLTLGAHLFAFFYSHGWVLSSFYTLYKGRTLVSVWITFHVYEGLTCCVPILCSYRDFTDSLEKGTFRFCTSMIYFFNWALGSSDDIQTLFCSTNKINRHSHPCYNSLTTNFGFKISLSLTTGDCLSCWDGLKFSQAFCVVQSQGWDLVKPSFSPSLTREWLPTLTTSSHLPSLPDKLHSYSEEITFEYCSSSWRNRQSLVSSMVLRLTSPAQLLVTRTLKSC